MKKKTGRLSSFSLSYDIVFLALVRMLYDNRDALRCQRCRCMAHPCRKRDMVMGVESLDFAARASALLSYHKLKDDIADDGFWRTLPRRALLPIFSSARRRAKMADTDERLCTYLQELRAMEREKLPSVDRPAHLCGQALGEIFRAETEHLSIAAEEAEDTADVLYSIGYELGRFVYAADAADDYDDDCRNDSYNPYRCLWGDGGLSPETRRDIHMGLMLQLEALERAVLRLPFHDADAVENIIKNIIYMGLPDKIAFLLDKQNE